MKSVAINTRYILCICLCILSFSLYAKDGIKIYGNYSLNSGAKGGVQIKLVKNGIKESSSISNNGKFEYSLEFDNQYELSFSKSGYITKKVVISTDVPERVLDSNSDFPPFKIEIELFRRVEGADYSIFDEPVAMVIYDKELDDFDYDRAYNAEVEEEIKAIEAEIIKAPVVVKVDEELQQYNALISRADKEFDAKSYNKARKTYDQALYLKPRENYPKIRIELIDKILNELAEKKKKKETTKAYYTLVDKADELFDEKKYIQARSYYIEAIAIKPNQEHPKDRVKLIDQIFANRDAEEKKYNNTIALGDKYFQEEKYDLARKSYEDALTLRNDEKYPREQISRIERLLSELKSEKEKKDNFQELISQADKFFNIKNWVDAKNYYQKSLDILPKEKYPKKRINEIDKLLKSQAKELKLYAKAVEEGDSYYEKEEWHNAKDFYKKALTINPNEVYPREQINKIDIVLSKISEKEAIERKYIASINKGDSYFDDEEWEDAKDSYFSAIKLKPEENYPKDRIAVIDKYLALANQKKEIEDKYNSLLKIADIHYDDKQWNEAITQYKAALEIKPSETYPKKQIKKVERLLQNELKKQTAEELENKYNKFIVEADSSFEREDFNNAIANYQKALQIKNQATYPKNQISLINEQIKLKAKNKETQTAFDEAISKANGLYQNSEFLEAIAIYELASDLKPNEIYPKNQIKKIRLQIASLESAKQQAIIDQLEAKKRNKYDETIITADEMFVNEQFSIAKFHYRKALSFYPNEEYPKKKINEIENLRTKNLKEEKRTVEVIVPKVEKEQRYYTPISIDEAKDKRYYTKVDLPKKENTTRKVKLLDPTTRINLSKYNKLIQKATKAETSGNIPFAKAYYSQAYNVQPSQQVFIKLKELDAIMKLNLKNK